MSPRHPRVVLADLDSMAVRMMPKWLHLINQRHGTHHTEADITLWDHPILKENSDLIETPSFFEDLPPMPGAVAALHALHVEGAKVHVCTAPASPVSAMHKLLWVQNHLPFLNWKHTIVTQAKYLVKADVLLDDSPSGIVTYRKNHPDAFIATIEYPYHDAKVRAAANIVAPSCTNPAQAWGIILASTRRFLERRAS